MTIQSLIQAVGIAVAFAFFGLLVWAGAHRDKDHD